MKPLSVPEGYFCRLLVDLHNEFPIQDARYNPPPFCRPTSRKPFVSDRLKVLPQYLLPKRALTRFGGLVASAQGGPLTTSLIRWFVRRYQVDMPEAAEPDIRNYDSFNAFFTRALKDGVRPMARADLVCPVDGAISQFGAIEHDQILQAKGHH